MGWEWERGQGQARLCQGSTRAKFGSSSTAPAGTVSQRAGSCPHAATTAMGTEGSVPHCGDQPSRTRLESPPEFRGIWWPWGAAAARGCHVPPQLCR